MSFTVSEHSRCMRMSCQYVDKHVLERYAYYKHINNRLATFQRSRKTTFLLKMEINATVWHLKQRLRLFAKIISVLHNMNSTSTPSANVLTTVNKARRMLFFIRRSLTCLTKDIFEPLYSALVRLHLEYATQANCPSLKKKKKKLALFMKRVINFQQMISCKEVLHRKDWRIINLLRVAGLQEDGPG